MANTVAQWHYTSETKPETVKQTTRKEPGAHPERTRAESWIGRATDEWFDVHSTHGGATVIGGGILATTVVKRIKQPVIEHHGIKAKLELC